MRNEKPYEIIYLKCKETFVNSIIKHFPLDKRIHRMVFEEFEYYKIECFENMISGDKNYIVVNTETQHIALGQCEIDRYFYSKAEIRRIKINLLLNK